MSNEKTPRPRIGYASHRSKVKEGQQSDKEEPGMGSAQPPNSFTEPDETTRLLIRCHDPDLHALLSPSRLVATLNPALFVLRQSYLSFKVAMSSLPTIGGLPRQSLLEVRRGGVIWLAICALFLAALVSQFSSSISLSEASQLRTGVFASLLRLASIFIVSGHVITSAVREHNDKVVELYLAQPISRATYYFGRFTGHAIFSALLALAYSAPLYLLAAPQDVAVWTASLVVENIAATSAALFFGMAFTQVLPAFASSAGLYVLGRSISTIQSFAHGPLSEDTLASQMTSLCVDAAAVILPRFDLVTRSEWLIYGANDLSGIAWVCGGLALYSVLLNIAGTFDLYRRNL